MSTIKKDYFICINVFLQKSYCFNFGTQNLIYVLPILDYCSVVWSPHELFEIRRIESAQRMFLLFNN